MTSRGALSAVWAALLIAMTSCASTRPIPAPVRPPFSAPSHDARASEIPEVIRASPHVALGVPRDGDDSDDIWLDRGVYVLSYNRRRNVANWVSWHVTKSDLGDAGRRDHFRADDGLPAGTYAVKPGDYTHSGFDRGHLCPSAERTRDDADNSATFLMSNVHPQHAALNQHTWKDLETYERELVARDHKQLFVIAGGLFGDAARTIGPQIAVPDAEFRIVVVLGDGDPPARIGPHTQLIVVVMPNDARAREQPWQAYTLSLAELETQSGYDFLSELPDDVERALERAPRFEAPRQ